MKLQTAFKVWIDNPEQVSLFIKKYNPNFGTTTAKAYYWDGDSLAHQHDDRDYFSEHRYPEVSINKLIDINYEIY
jgi:hypothetical protein